MRTLTLLLGLLAPCLMAARLAVADDEGAKYYEAFSALHQAEQFNGAVLIAKDDRILLDAYFGEADKQNRDPLQPKSLYRLASVSKTLTSTAVLALVERGALRLDDAVQSFLPAFPYPEITLRHVLQHSSGLPEYIFGVGDYWSASKPPMSNADVLDWLVATRPPLAFAPGTGWEYCNTGYALIPLIIASVTHGSYADHLRRSVLDPAGMQDSYHISELDAERLSRVAKGHGFDYAKGTDVLADRHPVLQGEFNADQIFGAGDVFSTALDLYRFDQALREGKLLGLPLQEQAYASMLLPEGFPAGYGLGWQVADSPLTRRIIHHHGQGDGYRTRFYRFLDRGITIVTLQNARERYADDAVLLAQQLVFKGQYTLPRRSLAEHLSVTLQKNGRDAVLKQVAAASESADTWSLDEQDLNNFAMTFWFQGDRAWAISLLRSYVSLQPTSPRPLISLAEALDETGDHAGAKAHYREALAIARKAPERYTRELRSLRKWGTPDYQGSK